MLGVDGVGKKVRPSRFWLAVSHDETGLAVDRTRDL